MGQSMKICFYAHDQFVENGASRSMIGLILELKKKNIDSIVILRQKGSLSKALDNAGIPYQTKKLCALTVSADTHVGWMEKMGNWIRRLYNYPMTWLLARRLRKEKIDLIHINKAVGFCGALLANFLHVPYVWHLREYLDEDYNRKFVFPSYIYSYMRHAYKLIAISDDVRQVWEQRIGNVCIVRIYNAVSTIDPIRRDDYAVIPKCILMIGSITEGKRQLDAVKAVRILSKRGLDVKLRIVGKVVSSQYDMVLKKYVAEHDLEKHVEFFSYTSNVYALREDAYIALLCSKREAFGRVTLEAMLSGNLFIGPDAGGTKELVEDHVTGLLYRSGDIYDLANKIELVYKNPEAYKVVIENARRFALEHFSLSQMTDQIITLYKDVQEVR